MSLVINAPVVNRSRSIARRHRPQMRRSSALRSELSRTKAWPGRAHQTWQVPDAKGAIGMIHILKCRVAKRIKLGGLDQCDPTWRNSRSGALPFTMDPGVISAGFQRVKIPL